MDRSDREACFVRGGIGPNCGALRIGSASGNAGPLMMELFAGRIGVYEKSANQVPGIYCA